MREHSRRGQVGRATGPRTVAAAMALMALSSVPLAVPAADARPIISATYGGPVAGGGTIAFTVSRNGRRVLGLGERNVKAKCDYGPAVTIDDEFPFSLRISRDGRFRGSYDAPAYGLAVSGRILSARATGRISYVDRGGCHFDRSFSARAGAGTPRFTG